MRIVGISTWSLEEESLARRVRAVAEIGYNAVSFLGDFLDATPLDELAGIERVIEKKDLLVTVHSGFGWPHREVDEKVSLAQAERILEWHAKTGRVACLSYDVPWVEISPGIHRTDPTTILGVFEKVLCLSSGSGVRVALEDCPLDPGQLEHFAGWTERFPHWGVLVDLGHMNMRLREPKHDPQPMAPGAVKDYLSRVPIEFVEIHVHSNDGTDDQHLPPYMGNADLPAAARAMQRIRFQGVSTIEFGRAWGAPGESLPAAGKSLDYWQGLLA